MADFDIVIRNGKAAVYTPFNRDFVSRVKLLGGRWDGSAWVVGEDAVEDVRKVMRAVYGRDDREAGEMVDVVLRFTEEVSELRDGVTILGRTIAKAWGRDSGARVGDDVRFTEGKPRSGGSAKNWYTEIPEGCVVKLPRVPKALVDRPDLGLPRGVEMAVIGESIDRDALEAEKEKLLARIAEIERLLERSEEE